MGEVLTDAQRRALKEIAWTTDWCWIAIDRSGRSRDHAPARQQLARRGAPDAPPRLAGDRRRPRRARRGEAGLHEKPITWAHRLENLRKALGRKPTLQEMLDASQVHPMTPEEREAQRESFARAMRPTGDPRFD